MDKTENVYLEKDEILANMYALRAGLSLVAVNSKKVNKAIGDAKAQAKKQEDAARTELKNIKGKLQKNRNALADANRGMEDRKAAGRAATKENAENAKNAVLGFLLGILVIVFSLATIAFCAYTIMFWVMSFGAFGDPPKSDFILALYSWTFKYIINGAAGTTWSGETNTVFLLCALVVTVASLPLAGFGLYLFFHCGAFFSGKKVSSGRNLKGMKSVKEYQKEIERYEGNIKSIQAVIPAYESDITKAQADGKALIANTCRQVAPTNQATMTLYKALQKTFQPFLDERDWDNLDLLTYYVETGRADTVKEALQLLDRQKQTDQIVKAVNDASGAICRSVRAGLSALQNDMHRCFNILSDQVTTVGRMVHSVAGGLDAMGSRINAVEGAVASQNAQISQIASEASLNRALVSCANESSAQLVSYAKTCANDSRYIAGAVRQAQISGKI